MENTETNEDGYPDYRRRNNGVTIKTKVGNVADNTWIIPHNLYLVTKYNCHINVEICSSVIYPYIYLSRYKKITHIALFFYIKVHAVKYLYKYIYKGPDKAEASISGNKLDPNIPTVPTDPSIPKVIDEIQDHLDCRYVSAIEGVWHFFGFLMDAHFPAVLRLDMHLENEQNIIFKDTDILDDLQMATKTKQTKILAWFALNRKDPEARQYLYSDIPKFYRWIPKTLSWQRRKGVISEMIGRMYFVSPHDIERFSLRLLLLNTPGVKSFEDLRTVDD